MKFLKTEAHIFEKLRRRQSIAVENMLKKGKKSEESAEFEEKLQFFEQKVKDLEFEKREFLKSLDFKESKLLKKREKIKNLRVLIEELRERLNFFNDKDLQNTHLLKMKEKQL